MIVLVMGVSGAGKTTLGAALAARLGCEFLDGDDWHPSANVAKMAAGTPLTDEDRWPWLERLNAELRAREARGAAAVLACSALKETYRQKLVRGLADWRIVFLEGERDLILARLEQRRHRYMPASLLASQFAALEPPVRAIRVDVSEPPGRCVETVLRELAR
jgi:carbohydrate kinase (thermoresistant glucokinase family)